MPRARRRPRPSALAQFLLLVRSGEQGKFGVGVQPGAAGAVLIQAPGNFAPPVELSVVRADNHFLRNFVGLNNRHIAIGASPGILEQRRSTLRARVYHWGVLRCGRSSGQNAHMLARRGARNHLSEKAVTWAATRPREHDSQKVRHRGARPGQTSLCGDARFSSGHGLSRAVSVANSVRLQPLRD